MRIAYLDGFSGISGDMFLGALVDAGVPFELLQKTVAALGVGATLEMSRVERNGISAVKIDVVVNGQKDLPREELWEISQHHDSHGSYEERSSSGAKAPALDGWNGTAEAVPLQSLGSRERHPSQGTHGQHLSQGTHGRHLSQGSHGRHLSEILKIIAGSPISERAKGMAGAIFTALGEAESRVHNVDVEKVHFHEVGAADAIVDIVCAAVGAEALQVDRILASPLNVGSGKVKCAHGVMPVPAPATLELLKGIPVYSGEIQKELVTPTGAAIVRTLAAGFGTLPSMRTERIGYGAGTRDFPHHSNVLRLVIGESIESQPLRNGGSEVEAIEEIVVLEANLDDLNPQIIGYTAERLLTEDALDVFTTAVQMKKGRPGTLLTVLCKPENESRLRDILFGESSTLGIRSRREQRHVLARRHESVDTPWGEVRIKIGSVNGAESQAAPEYEDCRSIAAARNVPLKTVMQEALRVYLDKKNG